MNMETIKLLATSDEYLNLLLTDYNKETDGGLKEELFKDIIDYVQEIERQKALK